MNYRYAGVIGLFLLAVTGPVLLLPERPGVEPAYARAVFAGTALGSDHFGAEKDLTYYLSLPVDADQNARGLALAKRAAGFIESKKYDAAIEAYDRAATLMPNLGDWLRLFAAGVAATQGDTAGVTKRVAGLDSVLIEDWAWRTRLRAYRNAEDRAGALRLARAATREANSRRRAEAWRAIGEIELEQRDTAAARNAFDQSMAAWPFSEIALDAARQLGGLRGLTPEQELQIGRIYLRWGNAKRGQDGLIRYITAKNNDPDTAQRVRYELGRHHFDAGRYKDAERVLGNVTANNGIGAEALFLKARAQYRDDRESAGRATFEKVIDRFPNTDAATRALFMLGDLHHDDGEFNEAASYFRRTVAAGGKSESVGIAYMRLATIALARGDTSTAITQLEKYRKQFDSTPREQQAAYWLGRLHAGAKHEKLAAEMLSAASEQNPISYYGVRSAELLADGDESFNFGPDPVTNREAHRSVEAALVRIDALYELGWTEAASFELRRLRDYFGGNNGALYALAEGLNERDRMSVGMSIGNELLRSTTGQPSRRLLKIVYPFPYRNLIVREARARQVDPYFMAALIRQESAFNPKATSSAGAMGLMQVMPATARALAKPLGIRRFKTSMLHNPETNVKIGTRFLSDMIRTWNGRPDYVLAAYNAGPSRMARWRRFPEARDRDLFMERIPFDETRDYVRVVQLNARIYGMLYGSEAAAPNN